VRELVDIHVAGQIIAGRHEAIDGKLGHGHRQGRLGRDIARKGPRGVEGPAGFEAPASPSAHLDIGTQFRLFFAP
jgi:hypothetical protein